MARLAHAMYCMYFVPFNPQAPILIYLMAVARENEEVGFMDQTMIVITGSFRLSH